MFDYESDFSIWYKNVSCKIGVAQLWFLLGPCNLVQWIYLRIKMWFQILNLLQTSLVFLQCWLGCSCVQGFRQWIDSGTCRFIGRSILSNIIFHLYKISFLGLIRFLFKQQPYMKLRDMSGFLAFGTLEIYLVTPAVFYHVISNAHQVKSIEA